MTNPAPEPPTPSPGSPEAGKDWTATTPHSGGEATGLSRPRGDSLGDSGSPQPGLSREELLARFPFKGDGRYEALDVLGEGGMGVVYKAFDRQLQRTVALKLLKRLEPEDTQRFFQEARAQAQVEHPNVCRIFEVGEALGHPFLVMQFVDGPTLREAEENLTMNAKVDVLLQVAEALHACHRAGIVHRDVKPGNIMLWQEEGTAWHAVLMDFGVARDLGEASLTRTHAIMGTPLYLSPEQAAGNPEKVDRRTDVYALGTLLYECLTGATPFRSDTTLELLRSIVEDEPIPPSRHNPDLPLDLQTIILKALEKDPARRYDSARAFGEDLRRYLDGDPILARRPSLLYQAGKRVRKNRLVATLLVILVLGLAYGLFSVLRARSQVQFAQQLAQEVERLDSRISQVRSLPRHDVSQEMQEVRSELARLEMATGNQGRWAQGAARLALGRGFLAIGDLEKARVQLEAARKSNPTDPEAAQALGATLARLYVSELEGLSGQALDDRRKELEVSLRQPALALLHEAHGRSLEGSAYAEGLLALVEGQLDSARTQAKLAQTQQPWFPEPWLLEAEIHKARAFRLLASGKREEALAEITLEGASLAAAQDRARSAPEPLVGEAQRRLVLLSLKVDQGTVSSKDRDWALEPVQQALEVAPGDWRALSYGTAIHRRWATYLLSQGANADSELDAAAADAENALAVRPEEAALWVNWATVLRNRAEAAIAKGQNPGPYLQRAEAGLQKALAQPRLHDYLLDGLGNVHALRAAHQLQTGEDPTEEVLAAAKALEAATAIRPWVGHDFSEGAAYQTLACYQRWKGVDPLPALAEALRCHRRGLQLQPGSTRSRYAVITTLLDRAEFSLDQKHPVASDLAEANKEINRILPQPPTGGERPSSEALSAQARHRMLSACEAGDVSMARSALSFQQRAVAASPENLDLKLEWGALALRASQHLGLPVSVAAAAALRAAAAAAPWDAWAQLLLADLSKREGHPDAAAILRKALKLNPNLAGEARRRGLASA